MLRLIGRRLVLGAVTLFFVSIIVFAATQALPGDAAIVKLGKDQTPEARAAIQQQLNLDEPVPVQYADWLSGFLRGDMGDSFTSGQPVSEAIGGAFGNSLALVAMAALIGFPLSLLVGVWSAVRRDGVLDHLSTISLLTIAALPEFVLGIGMILLFATSVLQIFPAVSVIDAGQPLTSQLAAIALPAITLAVSIVPYISRMLRASMIEVLESDYVAMARLKGLPERLVVMRHALVNGSGPALQSSAIALAYLAGGVVVVETVFGYPGLGSALIEAVKGRDVPVIQAITLIFSAAYVVVNIVADILTILVTPRLRVSAR